MNLSSSVLESVGFPNGAFTTELAETLKMALDPGSFHGKLTFTDTNFDVDLAYQLEQLMLEKFTSVHNLDVSHNSFTNDACGRLCGGLQEHTAIKTFVATHCNIAGGSISVLCNGFAGLLRNTVVETIKFENTSLVACNWHTWVPLAENKTLKKLSLMRSFVSP